ncbi:Ig-like domain-containing protein [Longitalea luteola]|uniref:Ig-like domain-containing protein n=1 Tax=Longitalea luteola TaxID=2812563 RepID=UPI001A97856B|nr:Ig-like domain-containing protein [Longitalea luteola]
MKRIFCLLVVTCLLGTANQAQVTENFNSRNGVALSQLKGYLQNHCWTLPDLDITGANTQTNGWLVPKSTITANQHTGVYTPVLDVADKIKISFTYQFDKAFEKGTRRWVKIYLTDPNNIVVKQLDSLSCTQITPGSLYNYERTFTLSQPGIYKVYLNYQGTGGTSRIAIDEFAVSAPLHYADGCNTSPVAVNDHITGLPDHTATGMVTVNDADADSDHINAYLIATSPDGKVELRGDGSFTFTPNADFTGNTTSFTYKVCDNGYGRLCSENATVKLIFPDEPISLNDFAGLYNDGGQVLLKWATGYEFNSNRFEIERSIDGRKWQTAGTVKAQGRSTERNIYSFYDEVGKNTALKKDLYYRLKQYDNMGKVATSRLLVVRVLNTPAVKMVSVTPNPAKNDISVTTQLNESSYVALKILNANGAIVMNKTSKADAGAHNFIMEGSSNLQPGAYTLDVTVNSKERMMVKLIKE